MDDEIETVREELADCRGRTDFERRLLEVACYLATCNRVGIERLTFDLANSREAIALGEGFWILVASGGSASCDVSLVVRDAIYNGKRIPTDNAILISTPFQQAYLRIPTGLTGTMVLWVARLPVPPPNVQQAVLRFGDTLVSAGDPLPVTAVVTGTPAMNVAQIGGTAQTGVDLAASFVRRAMTGIAPTSVTVGAASAQAVAARALRRSLALQVTHATQRVSLAFGAQAAVLDSGITILQNYDWRAWDALEGISEEAVNAIASGAGTTMGVQEAL